MSTYYALKTLAESGITFDGLAFQLNVNWIQVVIKVFLIPIFQIIIVSPSLIMSLRPQVTNMFPLTVTFPAISHFFISLAAINRGLSRGTRTRETDLVPML
jgi:hypothetical protein